MTTEMAELVSLWGRLQEVQLNGQQDEIKWKWTAVGKYSVKSAYLVQFRGSYCTFDSKAVWEPRLEGKHR